MTKKQELIEDFFDQVGFTERIVIGMYDKKRLYFHVNFTEELANGLVSMALMDSNIHQGLKQLKQNLERIVDSIEEMRLSETSLH